MNLNALYRYVLQRLGERTTYVGIVAILTACGIVVEPQYLEAGFALGAGITGMINVLWKEA